MIVICLVALLPVIISVTLWLRNGDNDFTRMTMQLTLKPYFTAPAWGILLLFTSPIHPLIGPFISTLPGAAVSLWMYFRYNDLFVRDYARRSARILLGLDCARWINSFFFALFAQTTLYQGTPMYDLAPYLATLMGIFGVALVPLYAVIALILAWDANAKVKIKPKRKNVDVEWDEIIEI